MAVYCLSMVVFEGSALLFVERELDTLFWEKYFLDISGKDKDKFYKMKHIKKGGLLEIKKSLFSIIWFFLLKIESVFLELMVNLDKKHGTW